MARLQGVDLPRDKRVEIALTYIYGIGRTTSQKLLEATGVNPNTRVHALAEDELVKLRDEIEAQGIQTEGDLRREVQADIRRKIEIRSAVSAPRPTRAPARARSAPSPARRRPSDPTPVPDFSGQR
jgi:small subunit ribosomal protein S13